MTVRPDGGSSAWLCARRLLRAGPADHLLALSAASGSLPIVGRHLEPLGSAAAMSLWGFRHLPDFVGATVKSWLAPGSAELRRRQREMTNEVSRQALRGLLPADPAAPGASEVSSGSAGSALDWPAPDRVPPLWRMLQHRRHLYRGAVRYGDHTENVLDVWRRKDLPAQPAPVLIFVPGGAWVHGGRMLQGYALLSHLAEQGWVCLSIDYRVAPQHPWPAHLTDVKTAIAWARANVDKFGGDRDFVAVAGCSAGGHLAALAGLTENDPDMQTELPEGSDTSVDAVVGVYGRYDWVDRSTAERVRFLDFLERVVVRKRLDRHPEVFHRASPMHRVHGDAPPFLLVHGSADTVIPVRQARDFADRLRSVSRSAVSYLELPGAGHGFDLLDGARTGSAATAVGLFLDHVQRNRSRVRGRAVG